MDSETSTELCNCKEIKEKLEGLFKDNSNLLQSLRELREENELLRAKALNRDAEGSSRLATVGDEATRKRTSAELESLKEINYGWKKVYDQLELRYERLCGENKLLQHDSKELKERVDELERRQAPLKSEIERLARELYAQNTTNHNINDDGSINLNVGAIRSVSLSPVSRVDVEEQMNMLRAQVATYKEDFERERCDRETLHAEKEKLKRSLEEAEEIIKKLTTELDACNASKDKRAKMVERVYVRPEDGYVSIRDRTSPQMQLVWPPPPPPQQLQYPTSTNGERWRYEQSRRGILPRNPPPTAFCRGGEVEVDEGGS